METKEYFEKVMQDFNQHRNGRSLRKYCQMEGIDYNWLQEYKKTYPNETPVQISEVESQSFIPLVIEEEKTYCKVNLDGMEVLPICRMKVKIGEKVVQLFNCHLMSNNYSVVIRNLNPCIWFFANMA